MLREQGCICQFKSAITGEEVSFVGFAFVDDMDKSVSSPLTNGTDEELEQAAVALGQQSADVWEGGMRATGGAVGPEKSFWCLISF